MTTSQIIRAILDTRGWDTARLAAELGTSRHTAEGWLYGRQPSRAALTAILTLAATQPELPTDTAP